VGLDEAESEGSVGKGLGRVWNTLVKWPYNTGQKSQRPRG